MPYVLRGCQPRVDAALDAGHAAGFADLLVKAPTGVGKSVMIAERCRKQAGPVIVIAHRARILRQLHQAIERHTGEAVGLLMAKLGDAQHYAGERIVCVGNLTNLAALDRPRDTALVVLDESHHPLADNSYGGQLVTLGYLDTHRKRLRNGGWIEGFTATPQRGDKHALDLFQRCAISISLAECVASGELVPPVLDPRHSSVDLDRVRATAGDFRQDELSAAVNIDPRNALGVDAWLSEYRDRQAILFCVDIQHCMDVTALAQSRGAAVAVIHGGNHRYPGVPEDERELIMDAVDVGTLDGVVACDALTEGVDLPTVQCIVDLAPTLSACRAQQKWGRGFRLWDRADWLADDHAWHGDLFGRRPSKTDCLLIDIVDNTTKHRLESAPSILGIDVPVKHHSTPNPATSEHRSSPEPRPPVLKPGWEPDGLGWVFTALDGRCASIQPCAGGWQVDPSQFGGFAGPVRDEAAAFRYADLMIASHPAGPSPAVAEVVPAPVASPRLMDGEGSSEASPPVPLSPAELRIRLGGLSLTEISRRLFGRPAA